MKRIQKITAILMGLAVMLILQAAVSADNDTEYIVKLKSDVRLFSADCEFEEFLPELGLYTTDDISSLDMSLVDFAEEDAPVELFDTYDYSDAMTLQEYTAIGIKHMWDIGVYGNGVRVGVVDSGCNPHQAIKANLCEGANFADDTSDDTSDNIGHGTAVSGIIAAGYGFNTVIGAARKTEIVPLKFIDMSSDGNQIGGTTKRLASAIVAAANDFDCDVINLSCGTTNSKTLKAAVDYALLKGVVIVAAVGNDSTGKYNYPAAYDGVIGVGSVNKAKEHSTFSNTNDSVFVTAPGEDVTILSGLSKESSSSGTSFSTPCITGIAADMLELNPELTTKEIMNILAKTSEDLGDEGYDTDFGYGLVRADKIADYMLSECECYASAIDLCSADGFEEVRFRFNDDINPKLIFAEYNDGILKQLNSEVQYVDDNIFMLRLNNTDGAAFRYFVWNSLEGMTPINVNEGILNN